MDKVPRKSLFDNHVVPVGRKTVLERFATSCEPAPAYDASTLVEQVLPLLEQVVLEKKRLVWIMDLQGCYDPTALDCDIWRQMVSWRQKVNQTGRRVMLRFLCDIDDMWRKYNPDSEHLFDRGSYYPPTAFIFDKFYPRKVSINESVNSLQPEPHKDRLAGAGKK